MTVGVFAESVPLRKIVSGLSREGVDVRAIDWNSLKSASSLDCEISKAVLIVSSHGAGEQCALLRKLLTRDCPLILCAPQPDGEGFQLFRDLGVAAILTPRTWNPEHISERILGQLILEGDLMPADCGRLVGATRVMRGLFNDIAKMAPLSDPVLIIGESGTGKELVAAEVHRLSRRPDQFLAINCGELRVELAGSELFGHKKGAFTGAIENRPGLLAEAGHGTVFLDEIGELDPRAQAILLRVLEDRKVRPIGSNQAEPIHARIVLATNRDLETECVEGRFKPDLFERIRGFTIELPPLREKLADLPLLVQHFLSEFNEERETSLQIPDGAIDSLFNYEWRGNVRELRAAVRNAAAYQTDEFISAWHLSQSVRRKRPVSEKTAHSQYPFMVGFDPAKDTWRDFLERARQVYFPAVLADASGNKTRAADRAGLSSSQFYEKLSPKRRKTSSSKDSDSGEAHPGEPSEV